MKIRCEIIGYSSALPTGSREDLLKKYDTEKYSAFWRIMPWENSV